MSEKTGRSYRRINSRKAESRPFWASATTSASGRLERSRAGGAGIGQIAREAQDLMCCVAGYHKLCPVGSSTQPRWLDSPSSGGHLSPMPVSELESAEALAA